MLIAMNDEVNSPAYPSLFATSNGNSNTVAPAKTKPNQTINLGIYASFLSSGC